MPKLNRLLWSGLVFFVGALVAVYGAEFTWRQVLLGGVALLIFHYADALFGAAFTNNRPFLRYQFAIRITNLAGALKAAGLYMDELPTDLSPIYESMSGKGGMVFSWLEPELFFVNTTNQFASHLEFFIDIPGHGAQTSKNARTFGHYGDADGLRCLRTGTAHT